MNNTAIERRTDSTRSTLDNLYNSIKCLFLQNHHREDDRRDIENMEKYYDEMDSGDMNAVIKSTEEREEKLTYSH